MNRDVAERLAATEDADIGLPQVRSLIDTFLEKLAICSMCEGEGHFTFLRTTTLGEDDPNVRAITIPEGAGGPCPKCHGTGHDPAFVAWHCFKESRPDHCRSAKKQDRDRSEPHANCGHHVMLPLSESPAKPSA
ncbi:MAG: hypothetical protein ABIQ09_09660 [Jatrophihabitantaceae bacterium]